jgi:hypothetical protein
MYDRNMSFKITTEGRYNKTQEHNKLHPSTKTELARSHRKDARYENGKSNILLESRFKKANRKTKDSLDGRC